MSLLIDPPLWPAHGTSWSHLVSDVSYEELHSFATSMEIPRRGFDLDHYDVPAARYDSLVAGGAEPVESRVLVLRLVASGLRVRKVDRNIEGRRRRKAFLRSDWAYIGAQLGVPHLTEWHALGEDLLLRWSEPHRRYHDLTHLQDVLLALDTLAVGGEMLSPTVLLAAWFHDSIYDGVAGEDERRSADLAVFQLQRCELAAQLAREVGRLVLTTLPRGHRPAGEELAGGDVRARLLVDADLAILAAGRKRYRNYTAGVRAEYPVPEAVFRRGRARILQAYLEKPWIYHTRTAREHWEERARHNLARELLELRSPAAG